MNDPLYQLAVEARDRAYAPYSRFLVGAAVECASGRTFSGANVENASFSHTICAERVAIATAVAAGERSIRRLVVVTDTAPPASPCGACRQVLHEFGARAEVVYANLAGEAVHTDVAALLPDGFDPAVLLQR